MRSFVDFIDKCGSIDLSEELDSKVELTEDNQFEINANLEAELSRRWMNPYGGWIGASGILESYGITIPKVILPDAYEGEKVLPISEELYLYYSYARDENGYYDTFAKIMNENDLNSLLDETESSELEQQ